MSDLIVEQKLAELTFQTAGEGFINITSSLGEWIQTNKLKQGILVVTTQHTSCSLTVNENADPRVLKDLSSYFRAIVPEQGICSINDKEKYKPYLHQDEGLDDMPAHIRTALTCSSLSFSINHGQLELGQWQAIYLWEHRHQNNLRKILVHAIGDLYSNS